MRKLEDLNTEELQEECERREIQLEISDGDEESFFLMKNFKNLTLSFLVDLKLDSLKNPKTPNFQKILRLCF